MAELPGWDRTRLAAAATADVEAVRMIVYARVMREPATEDLKGQVEVLEIEMISNAKRRETKVRSHQKRTLADLKQALARQKVYRGLLGLDDPDEPEPDDDDVAEPGLLS